MQGVDYAYAAAGAAMAAGMRGIKRTRIDSQSQESMSSATTALKSLVSASEYGEGRRAPTYNVRLRDAKYIKCDPLFKELFFPVLNINRNFGFCSTTGLAFGAGTAALNIDGTIPASATAWARSNGVYRGLSLFTIRSDKLESTDDFKLNTADKVVGSTNMVSLGVANDIISGYRRFNNGPNLNGNVIDRNVSTAQQLVWSTANTDDSKCQISEVGNLLDIETAALQSVNFQHAIGFSSSSEGTTSTAVRAGTSGNVNWDGTGDPKQTAGLYYPNVRNTTIRIADGKLEMDITNGKNSSAIIEIVINVQKKQEGNFTPQDFFSEVYQACEYQQNQNRVDGPSQTNLEQSPGGWQAFYDPEYPLLSLKSKHAKKARDMYRELHRSIHVLAPGQSKLVKVALGSHYYSLGNKCLDHSFGRMQPVAPDFGTGSLLVAIGHSGCNQLTMPALGAQGGANDSFNIAPDSVNSGGNHTYSGAGFWVGKQRAPSEIVIKGSYSEKFYPGYVISDSRKNYDDYILRYPRAGGLKLPAGLPVQETVGTVAQDNAGAVKIAGPVKEP